MLAMANKVCEVCGAKFTTNYGRQIYCSSRCRKIGEAEKNRARYRAKVGNGDGPKVKLCRICGKPVVGQGRSKYCSKACSYKGKTLWVSSAGEEDKGQSCTSGQLCWRCKWATGKDGHCPWARSLTPVPGWKATKTKIKYVGGVIDESYFVKKCPLYEEG